MQTNRNMSGLVVTMAATGINMILGLIYSWSVIKAALVNDLGWSNTAASLPYTVCLALLAFMTPLGGRMQDKYGPRRVALVGGILFGSGLLLSYFANTPAIMVLTYGVLCGLGMGFAYATAMPTAVKWFEPGKRGLIAGIVVAGIGLSAVYMSPLANYLLTFTGVDNMFLVLGIIAMFFLVSFALIIRNPPEGFVPNAKQGGKAVINGGEFPWREMLRKPSFQMLWLTYFLGLTAGLMIIGHIVSIVKIQTGSTQGFWLVMIFAIFNTLGRVVGGFLSDKIGRLNSILLVFLVQAANMFVFVLLTNVITLGIGIAVAGLAFGALLSLYPATTADFFGVKNLGANYGWVFTSFGVAGIVGPILGGMVADATGGTYGWAYIAAGLMLVVAAILVKTIKAPALSADSQG